MSRPLLIKDSFLSRTLIMFKKQKFYRLGPKSIKNILGLDSVVFIGCLGCFSSFLLFSFASHHFHWFSMVFLSCPICFFVVLLRLSVVILSSLRFSWALRSFFKAPRLVFNSCSMGWGEGVVYAMFSVECP